jgi:hypothetical protein
MLIPRLDPRNLYRQFKSIQKTANYRSPWIHDLRNACALGIIAPSGATIHADPEAPVAPPRDFISDIKVTRETEQCVYTLLGLLHTDLCPGPLNTAICAFDIELFQGNVGSRSSLAPWGETSEAEGLRLAPCGRVRSDSDMRRCDDLVQSAYVC